MDLINKLKESGITTSIEKKSIKFIRNNNETIFTIEQLEELFLLTLINQIKFQENVNNKQI